MKRQAKDISKPTQIYKTTKISAEKFVSVVLANDLSDTKAKTDTQLARELGINRRYFYDLLRKYTPQFIAARPVIQQLLFRDVVKMLMRRHKGTRLKRLKNKVVVYFKVGKGKKS